MSHLTRLVLLSALGLAMSTPPSAWSTTDVALDPQRVDVLVYGGTPAGVAAAIAAAEDGQKSVWLVEPTARLGGLLTCGLSHTDFRTFEGLTGFYLDFNRHVVTHYREKYGDHSVQVHECRRGTQAEPKVNLLVLEQMLAERPSVRVWREQVLEDVQIEEAKGGARRIARVRFVGGGDSLEVAPGYVIDATYEGDLMAAAGVAFRVGREGRAEYGESLAPEEADGQLQGYNFRLVMTRDPQNRATVPRPEGYQRDDFLPVLELFEKGELKRVFDYPSDCLYKAQIPRLPNAKYDINDVSREVVRLSLPGSNLGWPTGDAAARQRIFDEHLRHNVGLLYFMQNDEAVPARLREEAREWGLCGDEFVETGNLPPQLYVREARRMVGQYVFTEQDTEAAAGDARSVLRADSIAAADYGPNCHGTAHEGPRIGGRHTGEFYKEVAPYQVRYGTLVANEVTNLLVPVACSSSHVGFSALRLEPVWAALGQASGIAAALGVKQGLPAREITVGQIQEKLHEAGAATIYVSDVPPNHPDFAAVQWWGTAGGLHGLSPAFEKPGKRGKNIEGQYFEAFPGHAAELGRSLDAGLAARWKELASNQGLEADQLPDADRGAEPR